MKAKFLSIIIPVYKTEPYLKSCIDSILRQIRDDVEIILVDDGSPDACPAICDDYAQNFSFVRVVHKQNEGLSIARNTGLNLAEGKYVWFVDSDDYLLNDAISKVFDELAKDDTLDMLSTGLMQYFEADGTYIAEDMPYGDLLEGKGEYLWHKCKAGASQRYISNRNFLLKNDLFFTPGILHEDGEWGLRAMYLASKVKILESPVYVYRIRTSGSIMSGIKIKSAYDLVKGHKLLIEFMRKHVDEKDKKKYFASVWVMLRAIDRFCYPLFHTEEFDIFLKENYQYLKQQGRQFVKSEPLRLKSWFYLLHPYARLKLLKLLKVKL